MPILLVHIGEVQELFNDSGWMEGLKENRWSQAVRSPYPSSQLKLMHVFHLNGFPDAEAIGLDVGFVCRNRKP
jgi:hypothetical protein